MKISKIYNVKTGQSVCDYYCNKSLNYDKCKLEIGKPLRIVYSDLSYFQHEIIKNVELIDETTTKIETTKKIWIIHR